MCLFLFEMPLNFMLCCIFYLNHRCISSRFKICLAFFGLFFRYNANMVMVLQSNKSHMCINFVFVFFFFRSFYFMSKNWLCNTKHTHAETPSMKCSFFLHFSTQKDIKLLYASSTNSCFILNCVLLHTKICFSWWCEKL